REPFGNPPRIDQAGRTAPGRPRRRSFCHPARRQAPALRPGDLFSPAGHARTSRGEPVSQNPGRRMKGDGAVERLVASVFGVVVALVLLFCLLLLFQAYAGVVLIGCVGVAGWRLWRAQAKGAVLRASNAQSGARARPLPEVLAELDALVGLADVKAEGKKIIDVLEADRARRRHGLVAAP